MLQRIETEHCDKLEQLGKMQLEQDTALDFQNDQSLSTTKPTVANVSIFHCTVLRFLIVVFLHLI